MGTSDVMTELPLAARGQLQRLGTFCSGKFGLNEISQSSRKIDAIEI